MTAVSDDARLGQIARLLEPQGRLLGANKLKGGVSAQVIALEIERHDGRTAKVIVRWHGEIDLAQNPRIAGDEFRLLQLLQSAGVSAPVPLHLDESGEIFSTPYLVIEYIHGEPEFAPSDVSDLLAQLAAQLATIHLLDCSKTDLTFLPKQEDACARILRQIPGRASESVEEGRIRTALDAIWPLPQQNHSVLLHGDFWPGNVLWREGSLVAVIDWEDARIGDPLVDVANARLEILLAFGIDAVNEFTTQYRSITSIDFTHLPYWDLWAALGHATSMGGWGLDELTEKTMRAGHRLFVDQALRQLSVEGMK